MRHGIDVSYAQGDIDWAKAAADNRIDFAMIRATATYPHKNYSGVDQKWQRNIKEAVKTGLPLGVYHYSYALTVEDAKKEAEHFLNTIKGYKFEYPVVFDFEDPSQNALNSREAAEICLTWLETVQAAGYYAMLYSMADWFTHKLTDKRLQKYDRWVAHVNAPEPAVEGGIWQYTWTGRVNGIETLVDLNYAYKDYPSIIKAAGLNGFSKTAGNIIDTTDYKALYLEAKEKLERIGVIVNS
ncbi:MAG: glycoside hydrolase family 25 protein [Oscillospiraceae bacterium]|nr:glycoside hydrolase family 25 protein [Oscillospiraceae bacterium]